jgi:cellulose biosynthesis protein BcsQ
MVAVETYGEIHSVHTTRRATPILAIVNRKGGAGKTSAAHNIAGVWGTWGLRVCLVDLDTAFNLSEACGYPVAGR